MSCASVVSTNPNGVAGQTAGTDGGVERQTAGTDSGIERQTAGTDSGIEQRRPTTLADGATAAEAIANAGQPSNDAATCMVLRPSHHHSALPLSCVCPLRLGCHCAV